MSSIIGISTQVPPFRYEQKQLRDFMSRVSGVKDSPRERWLNTVYQHSGIHFRHSVLPDFFDIERHLFTDGFHQNTSIEKRMQAFEKYAPPLAESVCRDLLNNTTDKKDKPLLPSEITHLITVSCTGLSAPGLEISLMENLGLKSSVARFAVNFMGCYAVFPALKIADAICKSDVNAKVLLVSVELCTLHFQNGTDDDSLLANALFSDGAGAMVITSEQEAKENYRKSLHLDAFCSECYHNGRDKMSWQIGGNGFLMKLSSYVPGILSKEFGPAVLKLKETDINKSIGYWAIHPGGRRILDLCQQNLHLNGHLKHSYQILSDYGNMSSATVIFVLEALWNNGIEWGNTGSVLSAGFGPGLTVETAMMSPCA